MKDGLKDKYRQAIIDILSQCEQVEKVVLFGSRAMGTFTITSDVDIVLFGDKLTLRDQANLAEQIEELTMPQFADLLLYRTIESKELLKHIREYGVQWWPEKNEQRGLAMENSWTPVSFSDAVNLNPTVKLTKGEEYPFVDMKSVDPAWREVSFSELRAFKSGGAKFLPKDTLMARITPCLENGKIARYMPAGRNGEAFGSTEFIVIRGKNGVTDNDFAYYLTMWPEFRDFAISQMTGSSGRQRVPVDSLAGFSFNLPTLTEQKAIAHILGSLDDKIELNRRMNETLEAMAQALFKSWFIDFDPVLDNAILAGNLIPDELEERAEVRRGILAQNQSDECSVMNDELKNNSALRPHNSSFHHLFPSEFEHTEEMGWIPKGWRVSQLEKIAKFTNGKTSPDRSTGVIPVFGSNGCIGHSTEHNRDDVIIVGRVGTYCGSLHYCRTLCWVTDNAMTAEMNNKEHNTYLLELLKLANLNDRQGGSGQPLLNQTILGLIKFIKPSDEIISQFTRHSFEFYKKINFNEQIISNTSNLRDTLLPQLLTGEIRIPEAEKLVEEAAKIMRDEL